jgi:plasmid stabilization system protein ParE
VTFPRRSRPGRQPSTRELLALPPYIFVDRIAADNTVTILRIWHAAQDRPNSF